MNRAVVEASVIWSCLFFGVVYSFHLTERYNYDENDVKFDGTGFIHALTRHKRSSNSSSEDNRSAIEKFYDDPNNKAMYLVFPLFVLVIGTCCGLYFCDRCRKHFRKKKAEERKREMTEKSLPSDERSDSKTHINSARSLNAEDNGKESSLTKEEVALTEQSSRDDTPLEDVENCPEVKAVNAVPINRRETSFISDVQTLNNNNINPPSDIKKEEKPMVENKVILKKEAKKPESRIASPPSAKNDKAKSPRPTSKQSLKSINTTQKPENKESSEENIHASEKNDKPEEIKVQRENTKIEIEKQIQNNYENIKAKKRRDSHRSDRSNKRSITPESKVSGSYAYHDKTTPLPDVTNSQKYPKMDRKFSHLSPEAIGEIMQYYKDKKHMPDIIPDEDENIAPIKRKLRRAKYKIING